MRRMPKRILNRVREHTYYFPSLKLPYDSDVVDFFIANLENATCNSCNVLVAHLPIFTQILMIRSSKFRSFIARAVMYYFRSK